MCSSVAESFLHFMLHGFSRLKRMPVSRFSKIHLSHLLFPIFLFGLLQPFFASSVNSHDQRVNTSIDIFDRRIRKMRKYKSSMEKLERRKCKRKEQTFDEFLYDTVLTYNFIYNKKSFTWSWTTIEISLYILEIFFKFVELFQIRFLLKKWPLIRRIIRILFWYWYSAYNFVIEGYKIYKSSKYYLT